MNEYLDPNQSRLKIKTQSNPRLPRNKKKQKGEKTNFGFLVIGEEERPMPQEGLWGH